MSGELWLWIGFNVFVLAMLALDLGVFHRKAHTVSFQEAIAWSIVWVALALLFNLGIYIWSGPQRAVEFLTGYLIEKSLSVDNIFVFLMIFTYFRVPGQYQHKVLFWGIIGALMMRAIFIFAGVALIKQLHWIIYLFGGFLVYTGVKMVSGHGKEIHPERNPVLRTFRRFMPVTADYVEDRFFVVKDEVWHATPLFIVLLVVETTDVIFAVDSIPAILAITLDTFIVYSSNVFAILGLRALYFALAGLIQLFQYLHYGLSGILIFVGTKMLISDYYKIPIGISLGIVTGFIALSVLASLLSSKKRAGSAGN